MRFKGIFFQALIVLLVIKVIAMSPVRPDVLTFFSEDKRIQINIPTKEPTTLAYNRNRSVTWPDLGEHKHPKKVVFFPNLKRLVFLGGLGDPGTDLGVMAIFSEEGELLKEFNAESVLPNIRNLSQEFSPLPNFPWIAGLKANGDKLLIDVCESKMLSLNVKDMLISEVPRNGGKVSETLGSPVDMEEVLSQKSDGDKTTKKSGFLESIKSLFSSGD